MGWVVSFMGQKGGTGKSSLACAFAVDVSKANGTVTIADLDNDQRSSFEWSERRVFNNLKPVIPVLVVPRTRIPSVIDDKKILAIDCPGWSDKLSRWIADMSHVVVLPTGPSVHDLNPTIRLMQELESGGLPRDNMCCVLYRVKDEKQAQKARDYLKQSGFEAIKATVRDMKTFQDVQDFGQAITETTKDSLNKEAGAVVGEIIERFERIKQQEKEPQARSFRIIEATPDKKREAGLER